MRVTQRTGPLLLLCAILAPTVAIASPTYTVTDLGSTDAGSGFTPNTNYLPSDWAQTPGSIPTMEHGFGAVAFSYSTLYDMNPSGLAVGISYYGDDAEGYHVQESEMFAVQLQSNGLWGTPHALQYGAVVEVEGANGLSVGGISNTGQILGAGPMDPPYFSQGAQQQWWVFDSKDQSLTNLDTFLPGSQWLIQSASIDADGRILVQVFNVSGPFNRPDYLLLTPTGISAPTSVPEPTTLAMLVTAIGGGLLRGRASRKSASHIKG